MNITIIPPEHRKLLAALRPDQINHRPSEPIPPSPQSKRKRLDRSGQWPPVGTVLQGEFLGEVFKAEVIEKANYKSGKALRLLTAPVKGSVCRSLSAAQDLLTLAHRQKHGVKGKSGLPPAWSWFKAAGN